MHSPDPITSPRSRRIAPGNHAFYTQCARHRLVKKTVNQDDTSAYHLFYGDGRASPAATITFFEWPVPRESRGTRAIIRTALTRHRARGIGILGRALPRAQCAPHGGIIIRDGRESLDFGGWGKASA